MTDRRKRVLVIIACAVFLATSVFIYTKYPEKYHLQDVLLALVVAAIATWASQRIGRRR